MTAKSPSNALAQVCRSASFTIFVHPTGYAGFASGFSTGFVAKACWPPRKYVQMIYGTLRSAAGIVRSYFAPHPETSWCGIGKWTWSQPWWPIGPYVGSLDRQSSAFARAGGRLLQKVPFRQSLVNHVTGYVSLYHISKRELTTM